MNELLNLLESGKITNNIAKRALEDMLNTGKNVKDILSDDDLKGLDENELKSICDQAVKSNPLAVKDYLAGKEKAVKALIGFVMKTTKGRADARTAEKFIIDMIKK